MHGIGMICKDVLSSLALVWTGEDSGERIHEPNYSV